MLEGSNPERIHAPDGVYIGQARRDPVEVAVFDDEQQGVAIVAAAVMLNALEYIGKRMSEARLVCSGTGPGALACLDLAASLGLRRENIFVGDATGVVYVGQVAGMDPRLARFARGTGARAIADVMPGADIFVGASAGNVPMADLVKVMAVNPIVIAISDAMPEVTPESVLAVRTDSIVATRHARYPNQISGAMCVPFIVRGALDAGAMTVNDEMKLAAVHAIASLAQAEIPADVAAIEDARDLRFGPRYLIPKAFDRRLIEVIAPAVAKAAAESGVARRRIADMEAYRRSLSQVGSSSRPTPPAAIAGRHANVKSVMFAEGEDERVLHAAQCAIDESVARPVLLGRPDVIADVIDRCRLGLEPGVNCEIVDPLDPDIHDDAVTRYCMLRRHDGISPVLAAAELRSCRTLLAAVLLTTGRADAMLCGTTGRRAGHLIAVRDVIGRRKGVNTLAVMETLMLPERPLFICDALVNSNPGAGQIAEIAWLGVDEVRRLGISPQVMLVPRLGSSARDATCEKTMRDALALIHARISSMASGEGEPSGSAFPCAIFDQTPSALNCDASANMLVMHDGEMADVIHDAMRISTGQGISAGQVVLGARWRVHILTPAATIRQIVNATALAVSDDVSNWTGS
ncbi:phosphate acyltransferase [Burkholderia sp. Ac-20344]|uniref:phosphate acyltransferase n=1 Tax=Burkholderia sp. Ac-20344 TaxID=2703890 RepID=UPI00197CAEBC|nr:phosphate acyltransferase [Burkholderia sp. Ac-20344]MBN3832511.1 NADP-dependent malic enzyme [Burkholderia sp. Ac-20344]